MSGFDVDYCKAIAAAIFADGSKVKYTPLSAKERFPPAVRRSRRACAQHDLSINATPRLASTSVPSTTTTAKASWFAKELDVKSALELSGAAVCVQDRHDDRAQPCRLLQGEQSGSTIRSSSRNSRSERCLRRRPLRCLYDRPVRLYSLRLTLSKPMTTSFCRRSSPKSRSHRRSARWTISGSTSSAGFITPWSRPKSSALPRPNIEEMKKVDEPDVQRFLGVEADSKIGTDLGLTNEWGSISSRQSATTAKCSTATSAQAGPLKIEARLNALWNKAVSSTHRRSADRTRMSGGWPRPFPRSTIKNPITEIRKDGLGERVALMPSASPNAA